MKKDLSNEIKKLAKKFHPLIIDWRRHLHKYPELSFQEYNTAKFIRQTLDSLGIKNEIVGETGVLATIFGAKDTGKLVALRADIDAIPISEKNTCNYKSQNEGVMHACGHDAHTACALGAAKILSSMKDEIIGKIQIIFQPAEEKAPGGARKLLDKGIFKNQSPDLVIAQHVYPDLKTGEIGFKPGIYMASTDEIYISLKGKGGHAALPHLVDDIITIGSQLIVALQQISSRFAPPHIPTVLSFGNIIGNGSQNVIPSELKIEGTFRTMDEAWRIKAKEHIIRISTEIAQAYSVECEVEIVKGYPALINSPEMTDQAILFSKKFLSEKSILNLEPRMTGEDFSYFAQNYPAFLYRLGTAKAEWKNYRALHSNTFDIDENSLETGSALLSFLAISFLKKFSENEK